MLIDVNSSKVKDLLGSIIYKALRKADINLFSNSHKIINISKFTLFEIKKGYCEVVNCTSPVSDYIDKKNLVNFIGRNSDLENVIRKILDNVYNGRIITIKGSGGIGKTTLISKAAIEIAKRNYFEKGVYFIPCDITKTFESFKYQLSICFDLSSSEDLKRQITENFEYKSRLIILDNFESILYSSEKQHIMELIAFASDYACLVVTSRQLLELEYEDVYELRNFTSEEGLELFKSFYSLYKPEEEIILRKEIIEKILNNNPLAIKLIARGLPANKRMVTLKEELEIDIFNGEDVENIFEDPEDSNIERSKSLYHSINYSYQKLNQKEKLIFEIISLFPDGIHMENLKNSFKANNGKMIITDKDIKQLDNKSLLENSNGYIKLQSIINRFADHQFNNRNDKEKESYYLNAFLYNDFVADIINRSASNNLGRTLKILDTNISNFTKCLNYLTKVNVPDKSKFNFIDNIDIVYRDTNQPTPLLKVFAKLKDHYKDEENIIKYINLAAEYTIYWTNNFDGLHEFVNTNYPFDKYKYLDEQNSYESMIQRLLNSYYFHEGFVSDLLKVKIEGKFVKQAVSKYFFQLGYLEEALFISDYTKQEQFFLCETKHALGVLTEKEIDLHLKSIYIKDTLNMTQSSYLKQKVSRVSSDYIRKLSITNPYTKGLINLMLAINTNDVQTKCSLFEKAISNLERIKYYYTEAILQYSKFLHEKQLPMFESWFSLGRSLAQKHEYRYLLYQFDSIINNKTEPYSSDIYPCSVSKKEVDAYIKKHILHK